MLIYSATIDTIDDGRINWRQHMQTRIVGRKEEIKIFEERLASNTSEFLAVYGRRRVGKTFLVRSFFGGRKNVIFLDVTGMQDGSMSEQIRNFIDAVGSAFIHPGVRLELAKNWHESFRILTDYIRLAPKNKTIVLFFDEFPWMATKNSKLLQCLEYYWNHDWSKNKSVKLIICGSSSGWILKNIVNNKKGLYNRVTKSIRLEPFTLNETKKYLVHNGIKLTNKQVAELYMVLGGIPHYLAQIESGLSAIQIIEKLAFTKKSFLLDEFEKLYATLFHDAKSCIEIIRVISKHRYGITQDELFKKISSVGGGGSKVKLLNDLEEVGFIMCFTPQGHKKKGISYKVIDEYTLFYFYWIEPIKNTLLTKGLRNGYWAKISTGQSWCVWKGLAFEALCYKHLAEIGEILNLSPAALPGTWRYAPIAKSNKQGIQIDLLFDRDDDAITICEMKYTARPFEINKQCANNLQNKCKVFKEITKTTKQIFIAIISANGIKPNMYSEETISDVVTLDDLFKD
jgi:AAA+ ATPase superfamily predicted ATPase